MGRETEQPGCRKHRAPGKGAVGPTAARGADRPGPHPPSETPAEQPDHLRGAPPALCHRRGPLILRVSKAPHLLFADEEPGRAESPPVVTQPEAAERGWKLGLRVLGFPCGSAGKESACSAVDLGSIPGLGRSPGEGKGYPLQYPGLENSMDSIVHGVAKSRTRLSDFHFHTSQALHGASKKGQAGGLCSRPGKGTGRSCQTSVIPAPKSHQCNTGGGGHLSDLRADEGAGPWAGCEPRAGPGKEGLSVPHAGPGSLLAWP